MRASTNGFIRQDAQKYLGEVLEPALTAWMLLLNQTTTPTHAPVASLDISNAVNAIEGAITSNENPIFLKRFGYVRLSMFFDLLEKRIRLDRQLGFIQSQSGRGNASVAVDYYLDGLSMSSNSLERSRLRERMKERKREGGRWRELAGPSVFLLLLYSDTAEKVVYVLWKSLAPN